MHLKIVKMMNFYCNKKHYSSYHEKEIRNLLGFLALILYCGIIFILISRWVGGAPNIFWTWGFKDFSSDLSKSQISGVHKNANSLSRIINPELCGNFCVFHLETHSKGRQHLDIHGGFFPTFVVWEQCHTFIRAHTVLFSQLTKIPQRYSQKGRMLGVRAFSEHTWWGEVPENKLKLCPTKYFTQKCKYSTDFIIHLCIQLIFIECQVTRNKKVKKMQSQFSSPQSRRQEFPLGSIRISMQKQEPLS